MNIVQLQEALKDFSDDQLVREMQMPSGQAPQYLVLTELERREKSRQRYQQQQQPQQSVAEEALMTRMQGGIAPMAPQGMPGMSQPMSQPMSQQGANAPMQPPMSPPMSPPMTMAEGGVVKAQQGMYFPQDPTLRALMMQESGGDPLARGAAGEIGAFQIMPTTAISPGFNIPSLFPELEAAVSRGEYPSFEAAYEANKDLIESTLEDPRRSEEFARSYLDVARERFPGEEARAIAAYNVGMAGAEKLKDPSAFPYVQGVAEKGYSPDETKQAPFIPGISAAQAGTQPVSQDQGDVLNVGAGTVSETQAEMEQRGDPLNPRGIITDMTVPEKLDYLYYDILGFPAVSPEAKMERAEELSERAIDRARTQGDATRRPGGPSGMAPSPQQRAADEAKREEDARAEEARMYDTGPAPETVETDQPKTQMEMLMDILQQNRAMAEEQAEMDKYLALAQAGAQLAGSTQPTFLGALGEATQTGIGALQGSREGVRQAASDELDVMKALAVAEASAEAKGATTQREYLRLAKDYDKMIADLQGDIIGTPTPEQAQRLQEAMGMRDYYRTLGGLPAMGTTSATQNYQSGVLSEMSKRGLKPSN